MISVRGLTFYYNNNLVLEEASFNVADKLKVGLVGPNGAGKTTLLNLLSKSELPDEGKIEVSGTIGIVPQEVKHDPILEASATIREYLVGESQKADYELRTLLDGLELTHLQLEDSPQNLSGGQKTRLALGRALLSEPDLLLLDEPTNFMDYAGKRWVMNFLSSYQKSLIIISHDLELLDQAIDKVLFVNVQTKKVEEYTGNYNQFVKLKKQKEELLVRQVAVEQKHIKKMEESVLKLGHDVRQRINIQRRIARAKESLPELPEETRKIKFKLNEPAWIGELPLQVKNISKSYGQKVILEDVTFSLRRGERFALIGRNGAGKSTLIKILMEIQPQDSGEIIRDPKLKIGYYSQEFEILDLSKSLIEAVRQLVPSPDHYLRPVLAKFLFSGDKIYQTISTLSGGEKTRLAICLLVLQDYNLLVLDEPTTYLDVLSQRIILDVLKEYTGAMIVVSHTEDFIKELHPERVLILPENKLKFYSDDILDQVGEL